MNFELTDERRMLQDSLRRFLGDRYGPEARARANAAPGYDPAFWTEFADLGGLGALLPESAGGFGGAGFDIAVVFEELGRAGVVDAVGECALLAGGLLADLGTEAQRQLLDPLIAGKTHLALAHDEPQARYGADHVETRADPIEGSIRLTGTKALVAHGQAADYLIISAREAAQSGLSLFLVPADAPGLRLRGAELVQGGRAADLWLDGVELPDSARLGPPGGADVTLAARRAAMVLAVCAEALGAMDRAFDLTVDYLGQRTQFGRPIGSFQVLQHRVADMAIAREQARSAVIFAAGHLDAPAAVRDRHVHAAKHLVGGIARQIAEEAIQMHGGIAMTQEYGLAHLAKRLVMADHRYGDADHHLERFIALSA